MAVPGENRNTEALGGQETVSQRPKTPEEQTRETAEATKKVAGGSLRVYETKLPQIPDSERDPVEDEKARQKIARLKGEVAKANIVLDGQGNPVETGSGGNLITEGTQGVETGEGKNEVEESPDYLEKDMKRVTEFLLSLLSLFFSGDWKDKAKEYGVSQEDINNFKPNPNIDFSVLEKGDMGKLLEVAAKELEIDLKLIKGIVMIESSGRPNATRFEEHVYNRERKKGVPDEKAKLLSTSYGYFQIMGFNYKACGYESVEAFVEAMRDPRKQFEAFIKFVKSNTSLHIAMKNNDYTRIAYYYNGPKHAQNNYVGKLKKYV